MIKTLKDTTSGAIQSAILSARQTLGLASGTVFTLIVVADNGAYDEAFDACQASGREHPSRIILVGDGTAHANRLDAEIHVGESTPGELIALKFHGELIQHKASTLLPLLLSDSPVITWWAGAAPDDPGDDPLGALASRRITDAMGSTDPLLSLVTRAEHLTAGDVDMTWTRLTSWRALLAAAVDQHTDPITGGAVYAADNNAAGLLLAAWLRSRLGVEISNVASKGPGITAVVLSTASGDIEVARTDGKMASFALPGKPVRQVALRRREVSALLAEELRRLDNDVVFSASMESLLEHYRGGDEASKKKA